MNKPERYPLPWCTHTDSPYFVVNLYLCAHKEGWRKWQTGRPIAEIILEIDRLIANKESHDE